MPGWFLACPDKGEAVQAVVATAHHHAPSADHGRREDGRAQTRGAQRRAIASVEGMDGAVHRAHHGHACLQGLGLGLELGLGLGLGEGEGEGEGEG